MKHHSIECSLVTIPYSIPYQSDGASKFWFISDGHLFQKMSLLMGLANGFHELFQFVYRFVITRVFVPSILHAVCRAWLADNCDRIAFTGEQHSFTTWIDNNRKKRHADISSFRMEYMIERMFYHHKNWTEQYNQFHANSSSRARTICLIGIFLYWPFVSVEITNSFGNVPDTKDGPIKNGFGQSIMSTFQSESNFVEQWHVWF